MSNITKSVLCIWKTKTPINRDEGNYKLPTYTMMKSTYHIRRKSLRVKKVVTTLCKIKMY